MIPLNLISSNLNKYNFWYGKAEKGVVRNILAIKITNFPAIIYLEK